MKLRPLPALSAALSLASCQPGGGADEVRVRDAWVSLPAVPGRPAAGYFTLLGGKAPARLTGIDGAGVERAELHETMSGGGMAGMSGMSGMRPLGEVIVPAREQVPFEPGGRHLMLFGVEPSLRPGQTLTLIFRFDGRSVPVEAELRAPGDAPAR